MEISNRISKMMDNDLLQKLKEWRRNTANLEGVEAFQVFANKVLENIADLKPKNKDELMAIKGIRDRKFAKYGEAVLNIINNGEDLKSSDNENEINKPLSVSKYLDFLNREIVKLHARVQGEISSIDVRDRVIYFSLKDSDDGSVINCLIWKSDYKLSGVEFEVGMEVILEGVPDVYKPNGRLSFKTSSVELVGEGALKKAYDQLKKKLDAEGLFLKERKRVIPIYPQKIGVITSRQGAVLADFLSNIGNHGFKIKMIDSRVEGQTAVVDLLSAIKTMKKADIDVLVVMRGGGSFESLQPFNNELLVREIANFSVPVIAAIGHDKDVPLVSMVADFEVSTPSIAATTLSQSWKEATLFIERRERQIVDRYKQSLESIDNSINKFTEIVKEYSDSVINKYKDIKNSLLVSIQNFKNSIINVKNNLDFSKQSLFDNFRNLLSKINQNLRNSENIISANNPERHLKLGYSIAKINDRIVKSVENVSVGDSMNLLVYNGEITSEVKNKKLKK